MWFKIKKRQEKHPAIIERNLSLINHEVSTLDKQIEELTLDPLEKSCQKILSNSLLLEEQEIDVF